MTVTAYHQVSDALVNSRNHTLSDRIQKMELAHRIIPEEVEIINATTHCPLASIKKGLSAQEYK